MQQCCLIMNNDLFLENHWKSTENQQKFFIEFASQKGFDALVPENWNKIKKEDIMKQVRKKGTTLSVVKFLIIILGR